MIYYGKLFDLMKEQGKNKTHIRNEKIVSQETLGKLVKGTGIRMECKNPNLTEKEKEDPNVNKKVKRITAVDTKSIESLCEWLNCQPGDIMEVIPNTWDNAERICNILGVAFKKKRPLTEKELIETVPMEEKQ